VKGRDALGGSGARRRVDQSRVAMRSRMPSATSAMRLLREKSIALMLSNLISSDMAPLQCKIDAPGRPEDKCKRTSHHVNISGNVGNPTLSPSAHLRADSWTAKQIIRHFPKTSHPKMPHWAHAP
jgi:hypothetical protein